MGYILKTNNRKRVSGSTLKAKIVSPDKKDVVYKEFPVQVQMQTLSDKECVIRDMQQLDSILSINNPGWIITESIQELNTALQSATYGSRFSLQPFVPSADDYGEIIDANGKILRRPKYTTKSSNIDFSSTLRITVKKGSEVQEYIRDFVVPAYDPVSILAKISTKFWNSSNFWNLIRSRNTTANNIVANLSKLNENTLLTNNGINDLYDSTDTDAKPHLVMDFDTINSYYTNGTLIDNETDVADISASEMYQLKQNSLYNIEEVKSNALNEDDFDILGLIRPEDNDGGMITTNVVAYRLQSVDNNNNKISGTWTLGNRSLESVSVTNVGILSKKIDFNDIQRNVSSSMYLSWFINKECLEAYGITNTKISTPSIGSAKIIEIPAGKNPVLKISNGLSSLISVGGYDEHEHDIIDTSNIGYSCSGPLDSDRKGFGADNAIEVKLHLYNNAQMRYTNTPVDPSSDVTAIGGTLITDLSGINNTGYVYLDSSEFTSEITGSIIINLKPCPIIGSSASVLTTFYFTLKPASNS